MSQRQSHAEHAADVQHLTDMMFWAKKDAEHPIAKAFKLLENQLFHVVAMSDFIKIQANE